MLLSNLLTPDPLCICSAALINLLLVADAALLSSATTVGAALGQTSVHPGEGGWDFFC